MLVDYIFALALSPFLHGKKKKTFQGRTSFEHKAGWFGQTCRWSRICITFALAESSQKKKLAQNFLNCDSKVLVSSKQFFSTKTFELIKQKEGNMRNTFINTSLFLKCGGGSCSFAKKKKQATKLRKKETKKNDTKRWRIQKKSYPIDKEEKKKRKIFFFFNKNINQTLKGFFSKPKKKKLPACGKKEGVFIFAAHIMAPTFHFLTPR